MPFARPDINDLHRSIANKLACHVTRCCGESGGASDGADGASDGADGASGDSGGASDGADGASGGLFPREGNAPTCLRRWLTAARRPNISCSAVMGSCR